LRTLSEALLEIHGQQDDRGLMNPKTHLDLLDSYGGLFDGRAALNSLWREMREAEKRLDAAREADAKNREEEDYLRHCLNELQTLAPEVGEADALDAQRRLMQGAERIREDVVKADHASTGGEAQLGDAMRWLEGVSERADGALDGAIDALGRALVELGEAQSSLQTVLEALNFDPGELERVEERLFALRGQARKHAVDVDTLPQLTKDFAQRVTLIDGAGGQLEEMAAELAKTKAEYDKAASKLHQSRIAAARKLDKAVNAELPHLKLDRARFETGIGEAAASLSGTTSAEFRIATSPGADTGPINRVASGGELSRLLLALKVSLAERGDRKSMIFDEIDRGVGGDCGCGRATALGAGANRASDCGYPFATSSGERGCPLAG
jgi:DNA repair protein RecN (Recombination protein N)